jgi:hypothetical protein
MAVDLSGLGYLAAGMARGIPVGQEMVARQQEIQKAQEDAANRKAAAGLQTNLATFDPNQAIPAPSAYTDAAGRPVDAQGSLTDAAPWDKLENYRTAAMMNPDAKLREAALKQINDLALQGALHYGVQGQQAFQAFDRGYGSPQAVVDKLNTAFKFIDSNAPDNMFSLQKDDKGHNVIKDWKGDTVDNDYIMSMGKAAQGDLTTGNEYLQTLIGVKRKQNLEERDTKVKEKEAEDKGSYYAGSVYNDALRIRAEMLGTGPNSADSMTYQQAEDAATKGLNAAKEDPASAPAITNLPVQTADLTKGIIALPENRIVKSDQAAAVAAAIAMQSYGETLPEDVRKTLKDQFGETMSPYQVFHAPSDQKDANGNPVAYQVQLMKPGKDAKGMDVSIPVSTKVWIPRNGLDALLARERPPALTSGGGDTKTPPPPPAAQQPQERYESYTDAQGKRQVRKIGGSAVGGAVDIGKRVASGIAGGARAIGRTLGAAGVSAKEDQEKLKQEYEDQQKRQGIPTR